MLAVIGGGALGLEFGWTLALGVMFSGSILGVLALGLGGVTEKVDALSKKLGVTKAVYTEEPIMPQGIVMTENLDEGIVCQRCGDTYPSDYAHCPNCFRL